MSPSQPRPTPQPADTDVRGPRRNALERSSLAALDNDLWSGTLEATANDDSAGLAKLESVWAARSGLITPFGAASSQPPACTSCGRWTGGSNCQW